MRRSPLVSLAAHSSLPATKTDTFYEYQKDQEGTGNVLQCMTKITDGLTRITHQHSPVVTDFDGNDALLKDELELKQQVQHFAQSAMPEILRKALQIVSSSTSAKDVIQASKFIKSIADGQVPKAKVINGIVKKLSDVDLNTELQGTDE